MNNIKHKGWFKSLFESKSKHSKNGRLSVEHLEVRLTPDAKAMPAFHDFAIGISENNCAANSITLVDDIRLQQNATNYRSSQVYFSSNNSPNFPASTFQSVNKLDAIALQAAATKGVVLIDSSLIATIPVDELKGSLVVSIDSNFDVVSQITTALEGLANVPVLRIISHGNDGVLYFGNQAFDSTVLTSSAMQVASWGKSLTSDADILLYGCSIANTDAGKAFVEQFASITQADIGASTNLTGKAGDEVLEFQVGQVSNTLIASAIDYNSTNLTLAQITVTTTEDLGAGSLRQAITDANLTSANDEIVFASSLFTNGAGTAIALQAALPTIAATSGAGSLTITGPSASSLNINGNKGNFSIFSIASGGNLSISGVTVSGAQTSGLGGAFNNAGTLAVTTSIITGNSASGTFGGAGIFNAGTLSVLNSSITGNSVPNYGGGIYNKFASGNITVSNSNISGNSAKDGSGIHNGGALNISNSTLSGNISSRFGGSINNNGDLTISNSTFSSNSAQYGGGIFNNFGTLSISSTTFSSNAASKSGGGIFFGGSAQASSIANTIIANSVSGGDVVQAGTVGLLGTATKANNLITQGTYSWATTVTSEQLNLGPLQNNGGPTSTIALGAGSVAIGAGNATISNNFPINGKDQRGVTRSSTAPSIGAFEYIPLFSPQTTFAAGSGPYSVTLGDVNGDGKLDIVTANRNSNNASVLLGNGNGTFQTQSTFATGTNPRSVALGDVNGDGKLDIITANRSSYSTSVLLGNGNGTFQTQSTFATGGNSNSVTLGDVNGDGKLDIITANLGYNINTASVLLGNGNGTFQTQSPFATGTGPCSVTLGDVNGDGKLDIVTANRHSANASVLLGNGNGTFQTQSTFTTGTSPYSVTLGDVNGDGKLDIITANYFNNNTVSVLLGNGNGTFQTQTDFTTGTSPSSVTLGDVNGDGKLDIITANYLNNSSSVLLGNGNGTFQTQTTFATGSKPSSVTLGDVNVDGKLDIITANYGSNSTSVLLNTNSNIAPSIGAFEGANNNNNNSQFTVTTIADTVNSGDGVTSLREAIEAANATSANDVIVFASSLFTNGAITTITLQAALPTIAATSGAGSLTITVPGASSLIISGNNGNTGRDFRIFNIASGGNLSISGVTISGAQTSGQGGAFNNSGTLNIANSFIGDNKATSGGAFNNAGTLNIANSTLSNNSASSFGGAIENISGAILNISNSTLSNNSASSFGGGIDNFGGTLTVISSTLSGNSTTNSGSGGGGIYSSGPITIANTIIANSTGGDFAGPGAVSLGTATKANNLITQGTYSWATTVTSEQLNLGPLQNNGGPTSTIALGAGSVAIGAGNATISNNFPINGKDQRGVTRSSTAPSIGAFEGIATAPTVTLNTANLAATLTIAGTGFSTIAANNTVTLNSGTGTVTSATATQLTITFTTLPSATGSLTAIITSFGITSGSPVQVGTLVAAPSGTSFGTAIALTAVTGGFSADGIISVAGEADYYTFTAAATGVVNFAMNAINNSGVDSILTIYDANFLQIAQNDDSNGTFNSFVSLNVTAGSVYFLMATAFVSSIAGATGATGAYRVSATPIAPAGASFGTAIALTAQQGSTVASYDGDINPALEADFYTYTATATGVVNFAMAAISNSGVDTFLTIYNSPNLNAEIARNDDSNGTLNSFISLNVTAGSVYYLRATAFGLGTGAYRVSATPVVAVNAPTPAGTSFGTAIPLTAPQGSTVASFDGVINPALEADFYTYTATATGVVNFAMAAINNSGVDSILTIYNSPNLNAEIARNDDSNGTLNSFISLPVIAGNVYYIKATAYGLGTGAYRVSATFIAPTSSQASAPGDSFATAITLTAPQNSSVASYDGVINPALEADYYKYIATATGVVNFAMTAINNSGVDTYLTIYNSNFVQIAQNDDSNGTLNSFISLNVTANAFYYIKTTAYGSGTGAYQVSATVIAAPTGAGTTFATAITLTAGNPITGNISTPLQADFYTYTAVATGVVNFAMTAINNSGVDTFLTIFDANFLQIAQNDDSNGTFNSFVSLNVNANAIYYLKATAFGSGIGAYQVSATFIAPTSVTNGVPGDSFMNAITISASVIDPIASYDGVIHPALESDYYKYTATATGVVNFAMAAINNSGVDSILTIYNFLEVQIAQNDDSNGTFNSFISLNVTAGDVYYLRSTAYGSGTGAYRVSASSGSVFNSTPPGATFGTAINLTAGEPIEGVISNPLEADYYKYIATATGVIDFAMNAISNSAVDTYLTIYNSNFVQIAQNDDSNGTLNSFVSLNVNANALYYIQATAYGSDTGAYRISATNSVNQNTSAGASFATAINLPRAVPIAGVISTGLEADYYKYLATATGVVNFAMTATSNPAVDTYLTIYNSNFIEIAHDDDSGSALNSSVNISVTANEFYYIQATAYGLGTGAYQVLATPQGADDVGDNLDATATLLSFTGNVASQSKTIGSALDVDVFSFTADVEGVYEIAVTPANASTLAPVIEVIRNDGTTSLVFSSAIAGVAANALPFLTLGQQVYVRVSGAGTTGNYTLQVTKPAAVVDFYANNYNTGTNSLPVGIITLSSGTNSGSLTNANMVIESATDFDVFSFTTNRSGPIQVSVSKAVGSNLDTIVSILDASGNVLEFNDDSNGTTNSTVVFQANNNTLYYIRVSGYGGTIGRFDISVTDLTPTVAETDGAGTDLNHATALTVDVPRTGNISSAGDQDFFSFTASSNGILTISLAAGVGSGLDTYLYLYNSDKVLILEDDDSGTDLNSLISTNVLTGQTYYFQASGFGSSTGAYTISASISAADDHANQAGESATRLIVSSTNAVSNTAGTINPSTDNDVFLYKATANGSITINVTPTNNSALNSYLFVYDSTGNILRAYNDGNSSTDRNSRISLQVVRDEVYYFMVSGAAGTTGAYNISVAAVTDTVGNTILLATNLPVSTPSTDNTTVGTINGSIGSTGDVDFYKVAINTNGRYVFRASANPTSNGLDTTIAVYSEDGQLMGENDDTSASSLNSSLSLNLTAGEIVYVRVAGYGESTGDYIFDVVYLSAAIADDFGNTIANAYSFVLDNAHSYTVPSANIQFAGDADVFHGVADLTGNITLALTPSANLQGNIRAFVHRNGENIQVGSVNGSAVGGVVNLTFPVSASENFYIEISGNNGTTGAYSVSVNNVIATNTVRPTADSVIDRIAEELREEFTQIIAAASANADINETSSEIMTELLAVIQRLIQGFTGFVGFFDPTDIHILTPNGGGTIGSQGSNSTNSNPSASLSSRGALDLVVIPGAAAGQYNLTMAGTGGGQVLAGVAMVGANGQIITPTITGGQSSGGIAASNVPKTGLNLVLDFGSNSGNGGGGNNGGRGDTAQSGPVAGSTTASTSASASSTSASSTASAATGLASLAALANAITQSATASGAETGASSLLANLASIALGLGNTAATLDEKQLAKDLGGDAPAGDLDLSSLNTVKTLSDFVTITFAQAYKGFNQAVFSTLDAENQVVSEITNIFDKVLPALVPSEFENAVENLLVQTKKSLLEDAKATLLKTGDILADIIMSKLIKNLPAAQPAKNKVDAKVPSFEFVIANFVQQNKNDSTAEENCFGEHTAITEKIPQCFEEIFNSVNRSALDDSLTGPSILLNDQQNKAAEALGVIAGVLLAPGFLSSTNGTQAPAFDKPKPRKQKS